MKGGTQVVRLGDVLRLRKDVVHPYDKPVGPAVFVGLEHVESGTGRRTGSVTVEMSELTGRKPRFYKGDIVYGYLRPYLNKVWIAEFDGLCSVDQYVYEVDTARADPEYIAWFMRSPTYLERAPISTSPGQLPRIRTEEVGAVQLELPTLDDQRRAALKICRSFDAVRRAVQAADAKRQAVQDLYGAVLRVALNCNSWPMHRLGEVLARPVRTGISKPEVRLGSVRCLSLAAVRGGLLDLAMNKPVDLSPEEAITSQVKPGALYVVRGNGRKSLVGRGAIAPVEVPRDLVFPDLLFEVVPNPDLASTAFLRFAWESPSVRRQVEQMARTSAGIFKINTKNLVSVSLQLPSVEEQERIAADLTSFVAKHQVLRDSVAAEFAHVDAMPQAVLRRSFGGS